jgi:hypothetical protein
MTSPDELGDVRERVRARYAGAAATVLTGGMPSCGESCSGEDEARIGAGLYSGAEQEEMPGQAVAASLACGNPVAVADLRDSETALLNRQIDLKAPLGHFRPVLPVATRAVPVELLAYIRWTGTGNPGLKTSPLLSRVVVPQTASAVAEAFVIARSRSSGDIATRAFRVAAADVAGIRCCWS